MTLVNRKYGAGPGFAFTLLLAARGKEESGGRDQAAQTRHEGYNSGAGGTRTRRVCRTQALRPLLSTAGLFATRWKAAP